MTRFTKFEVNSYNLFHSIVQIDGNENLTNDVSNWLVYLFNYLLK